MQTNPPNNDKAPDNINNDKAPDMVYPTYTQLILAILVFTIGFMIGMNI
jgi:hypothetical protein